MTHPILPKLKDNHNVKSLKEAGKWDIRDQESLSKLSDGLKVDKVETEISSIPDMWARPILFEMALTNRAHVLHERIRGEWRGVLAMLGLKELLGLNRLTTARVILPQLGPPDNGENQDQAQADPRDFLLSLTKLLPKTSLASDTTWKHLYVFLYGGRPFAMTSPTTLVSTASDYSNRVSSQDVRWFDGTYLNDPVSILPLRQRQILSGWLANLIASLDRHNGKHKDRWDMLSGQLQAFQEDLGPGESRLGRSTLGIQGTDAGVFKYLDRAAEGNLEDTSHVQLIASSGRSPNKRLLVFDGSIAEQWGMSPQNVTVDGAQTLASAHVEAKDAEIWRQENFFNKKLFVIFQENAFPTTLGPGNQSLTLPGANSSVTPILPLNPELLGYLTAEDLAERVRWDPTPEGLVLRLFLPLTGPDASPGGSTVELRKTYKREDIKTLDNVPILEIWPNFRASGWSAYYTCYSTDDVSGTFTAEPFVEGESDLSELPLAGRRQRRYWRSSVYPEAIVCSSKIENEMNRQMETVVAGLLLLTPPPQVQSQGDTYKVGIDFGASSTTICASIGQHSFPVNLKNRKTSVTASGPAQAQLFEFFLPRSESEMPVLSFFQDFNNRPSPEELRPFLDGHAYLLDTADSFNPVTKGLSFDLKWSRDDNDRRRVGAFLTQLCLQTAAELVVLGASSAAWAFSYPTAFSREQIQGFPSIWAQVTADCATQSGLKQKGENVRHSESEATALYFVTHRNAPTAIGTVFIDIGGSTSDISIWQDDKPVWQTSVLLAGRSIFSNYLWYHPEFLRPFDVNVSQLVELKSSIHTDRRPYHALTDVLLRYNSDRIFRNLPLHAATEPVIDLKQHLALGVSGLFYYVGTLLRYLVDHELYRPELPNVFVGGNGSRIFRWLDIDRDRHINVLYKEVFSSGAQWPESGFEVVISEEPKIEAAYGLVSNQQLSSGDGSGGVLAGESFVLDPASNADEKSVVSRQTESSNNLAWNTTLTAEMFTHTLRPPTKLDRLAEFINTFNKFARNTGLIPPTGGTDNELEEVRRRLGQSLARYRGSGEISKIVVEPIFIVALRHWLEIRLGG
ncbi:MAG TPA: hypothetical protein VE135_23530 [Pyrinomonadaceae bacterium]|nr:hypothetical protein [Pyrinomonadaceae bacterium]